MSVPTTRSKKKRSLNPLPIPAIGLKSSSSSDRAVRAKLRALKTIRAQNKTPSTITKSDVIDLLDDRTDLERTQQAPQLVGTTTGSQPIPVETTAKAARAGVSIVYEGNNVQENLHGNNLEENVLQVLEIIPNANRELVRQLLQQYQQSTTVVVEMLLGISSHGKATSTNAMTQNLVTVLNGDAKMPANPFPTVIDIDSNDEDAKLPAVTYPHEGKANNPNAPINIDVDLDEGLQPTVINLISDDAVMLEETVSQREEVEYRRHWTYDYNDAKSFNPTDSYVEQGHSWLLQFFPFLSSNGAKQILLAQQNHVAKAFDYICKSIQGETVSKEHGDDLLELQYTRMNDALVGKPLDTEQKERLAKLSSMSKTGVCRRGKAGFKESQTVITDKILQEEVAYIQQTFTEWNSAAQQRLQRNRNQQAAQKNGSDVECPCCCDSFAVGDMIACRDEGHLFCVDCLLGVAKSQIFGSGSLGAGCSSKSMELRCFHPDGCESGFAREFMQKALPRQILEKYDELQASISVREAALENLVTCPKCTFQAQLDPTAQVFVCPIAHCGFKSCCRCGMEASHVGDISCEEAKRIAFSAKGQHKVEEAMSGALIAPCPKCASPLLKEGGCNKMVCPRCREASCFVCRSHISKEIGYAHFCQKAHCQHKSCGKCPLHTTNEDKAIAEAVRKAGINAVDDSVDDGNRLIEDLMRKTPKSRKRRMKGQR